MSEVKSTPGPWFINGPFDHESDLFIRTRINGENLDIANLSCDETGESDYNSKLIAAAPDLLEAAIEAIRALDMDDEFGDDIDARHSAEENAYHLLLSAIKKAKGEHE